GTLRLGSSTCTKRASEAWKEEEVKSGPTARPMSPILWQTIHSRRNTTSPRRLSAWRSNFFAYEAITSSRDPFAFAKTFLASDRTTESGCSSKNDRCVVSRCDSEILPDNAASKNCRVRSARFSIAEVTAPRTSGEYAG